MALGVITKGSKVLAKIDEINFFDAKTVLAQFGAELLFGQGIVINSDNEKIKNFLQKTIKKNKFDDLMLDIAEQVNYWGRVILTIDRSETGEFVFSYATPELMQIIDKIEITPFSAKIMKRKVVGNRIFFVNEIWTSKYVKRSLTVADKQGNFVQSYDPQDHGEVPDDLKIPLYEEHNLGFVPFIEITNKPARNLMLSSTNDYARLADDYAVRHMPIHINNGMRQMLKEEILGKSKLAGFIDTGEIKKRGGVEDFILADAVIETKPIGNGSTTVATQASTYDGMKWLEPQKQKINIYARGCGYSDLFPTENAQTEAETLYSKDNNQRKMKSKRRRYTELLTELFTKLLVYKGLMTDLDADPDFSVEIKENVVYNQLQLTQFLIDNVNSRLMTQLEAIMMQRDLDNIEDAEEIMKTINAEADARDEKEMQMMNQEQEEQKSPALMGKAGAGKDPDTDKDGK